MICKCSKCGQEFTGEFATVHCEKHEAEHRFNDTPAITGKPYIREYEVLKAEYGDYGSIRLKYPSGHMIIDGAARTELSNTGINIPEKLIGKKIRITTLTEIIDDFSEN